MTKLSGLGLALAVGPLGCGMSSPATLAMTCLGNVPASGLGAYSQDFVRHVSDSDYVFRATVTAVNASSVPNTTDKTNLVIATIDAVAVHDTALDQLGNTWGTTVTIDLQTANLAVGDSAYFFTTIDVYNGGQLEVSELGRAQASATLDTPIAQIRALLEANPLYAAIATSVAVVAGDVAGLGVASTDCGSEHCAMWQPATFAAADTLCGTPPAPDQASFASSTDIAWSAAPKLVAGQTGVFLLHHPQDDAATSALFGSAPALSLARQVDVQPIADEAQVEGLLASPPSL